MIDWQEYKDTIAAAMTNDVSPLHDGPISPQIKHRGKLAGERVAEAIVNGYVLAVSDGGDPILKASAVLNSAAVAIFLSRLSEALSSPDETGMRAIRIIVESIPLCWAGAILNAAPQHPLPGHIRHSPISSVVSPGIMPPFFVPPASARSNKFVFIDNMIIAMKTHLLTVGGIHPAMILPAPAPPYPFPWMTYQ